MNAGILTQEEAERLISMLKKSLINEMYFPSKGKSKEFEVQGDGKGDSFTVGVYRGKINGEKYNFSARIKINNTMLLELHVSENGIHKNPDGTKIVGNHWHIYTEKYGRTYAIPAAQIESPKFVENTLAFLDRFNVINKPQVLFQPELL